MIPRDLQVLAVVGAVTDVIRDMGTVPSGSIYAHVMGYVSLAQYEQIIEGLVQTKLVRRGPDYLLTWIGPKEVKG